MHLGSQPRHRAFGVHVVALVACVLALVGLQWNPAAVRDASTTALRAAIRGLFL